MTVVERFAHLPWPLFIRACERALIPKGSFSEAQTDDARALVLKNLVKSLGVKQNELEEALSMVRVDGSGIGGSEEPHPARRENRKIDIIMDFIKSIDKTTTDLHSLMSARWR